MAINVITIGGGTGSYNVLSALKHLENINISAIVSMSDDGGSTGRLRDEYGVLPSGDIRRAIVALSDEDKDSLLRNLFNHRFNAGGLGGHNLGNLIMVALEEIAGDYTGAIDYLEELFEIKGRVYPVTLQKTRLLAKLDNNQYIVGETNIDIPKHDGNIKVKDVYVIKESYSKALRELLNGGVDLSDFNLLVQKFISDRPVENPKIQEIIQDSDYLIFCPGDFFTSILPNILVGNTVDYLRASKAKKILFVNLFTKFGETNGFKVYDFIKEFEKYIGEDIFDYILVQDRNKFPISEDIIVKYKIEKKELVEVDIDDPRIIKVDFVKQFDMARHDSNKIRNILEKIIK